MCDYQCTSVSFIKLRIESNRIELFFPESECSTGEIHIISNTCGIYVHNKPNIICKVFQEGARKTM